MEKNPGELNFELVLKGNCINYFMITVMGDMTIQSGIPPHTKGGVCTYYNLNKKYRASAIAEKYRECIFCENWRGPSYSEAISFYTLWKEVKPTLISQINQTQTALRKKKKSKIRFNRFAEIDIVD